ncbi:hypothetical protein IJH23_02815 [Candidatus Saccharibacteria bacterium]|nr:hypothetical protein [Candidatus Saccharibacteria bacterium]
MESNTFSITPMSQSFSLYPGKSYKGSIKIVNYNDSKDDLHYKVSVSPYGVIGEEYTADLTTVTGRNEIAKWITIDEPTGVVAPNATKKVSYTITVPETAASGGQYATIGVSSNPDDSKDMITNVFELASVIYAEVAGENVHGGSIIDNLVPVFSFNPDAEISTTIDNTGNVHNYATIEVKVNNFFTGDVIYPTKEDEGTFSEVIMPETTRLINRKISNLPALGVVHISQSVNYNGKTSVVEKNLIICPIWFILLVIATITTLVTVITLKVRRHKKSKAAL